MTTIIIVAIVFIAFSVAVFRFVRRPALAQTDAEVVQNWIVDTVYKTGCPLYAHWYGEKNLRVGTLGPINDAQVAVLKKCVADLQKRLPELTIGISKE